MSFEISSMNNFQLKSWAQKCDADSNGKIEDDELLIFQQGKENMHKDGGLYETTVDGVTLHIYDVETIKRNEKGAKFDNTVKFKTGVTLEYDKQAEGNEASAVSMIPCEGNFDTISSFRNITDGDGFKVKGTRGKDEFDAKNCKIDTIDGLASKDKAYISSSIGSGNKSIFAEKVFILNSDDLVAKPTSKKILRPTGNEQVLYINKANPNGEYGGY